MSQAAVKIKPMAGAQLAKLVSLLYDAWNLEAVIAETKKVQHIAERVSASNRPEAETAQVEAIHAHQESTVSAANTLGRQINETLGTIVAEFLAENGIVKGMTLFDSQGLPFTVQRTLLVLDWQRNDAVNVHFKEEGNEAVRLSVCLNQGALVRVAD